MKIKIFKLKKIADKQPIPQIQIDKVNMDEYDMELEEDDAVYFMENATINQTGMIDSTMVNINTYGENSNSNDSQLTSNRNNYTTEVSMDPLPIRPQRQVSPNGMMNNITQNIVVEVSRQVSQLCDTQQHMDEMTTTTRVRRGVDATYTLVEKTVNEPTGLIGNQSDDESEEEEANEPPTGTYLVSANDKNRVKPNETLTKPNV